MKDFLVLTITVLCIIGTFGSGCAIMFNGNVELGVTLIGLSLLATVGIGMYFQAQAFNDLY